MKEKKLLEDWQVEDAQRLRRLFEARLETVADGKLISQMEFGAKYGIGSQSMVWQYLTGYRPLNIKAAVAFARGLGVKIAEFSPTLATQIDDASQVEQERPALRLAEQQEEMHLQHVSRYESALLSASRMCTPLQQHQLLAIATDLANSNSGVQPQGDGQSKGRHSG